MEKFNKEMAIKKLLLVKQEIKMLLVRQANNQRVFDELCDNLDNVVSNNTLQEASTKLTLMLDQAEMLKSHLEELNAMLKDLEAELKN